MPFKSVIPSIGDISAGAIDHNALLNTHNLTTDIDHDQLTNYVANDHINVTNIFTQNDAQYIATDEIRARDGDGLKLYDDSGAVGIFIEDGGDINVQGDLKTDRWLSQDSNTFIGVGVAGSGNLAHGSGSEGYLNTVIGNTAMEDITTGYGNVVVGNACAPIVTTGYENICIGSANSSLMLDGYQNIVIGVRAGPSITDGNNNTVLGSDSGALLSTGDNNIIVGSGTANNLTTGSGNIVIGNGIDARNTSSSNYLIMGGNNTVVRFALGTSSFDFYKKVDSGTFFSAVRHSNTWSDDTEATRTGLWRVRVDDWNSTREIIRGESTGTEGKLSFFGATAIVRQSHIVNADGNLADITTKFNTLLSYLESYGLLKTS